MFVQPAGTPDTLTGTLANGATVRWTATFSPAQAEYGAFGVYPLEVQAASSVSAYVATDRTFLPFWPGERQAPAAARGVDLAAHRPAAAGRVSPDAGHELPGRQPQPPAAGSAPCWPPASNGRSRTT